MSEIPNNNLPKLPPKHDIETKIVLKHAISANRELARLKGYCSLLPNDSILLSSIILKEASASSEIENIITTQDDLYRAIVAKEKRIDPATKEVLSYRSAFWLGYTEIKKSEILRVNTILSIQEELEQNSAGLRKFPGTSLVNDSTGEVLYTPPDNEEILKDLLTNLEKYINSEDETDHLIKMAIIHYQFESIHPFYDGNGRTGRIINVLYLVLKGLLDSPILFLSSYIIKNKSQYYKLLQQMHKSEDWENWVIYMLNAVEETAKETYEIISEIMKLLESTIEQCKKLLPNNIYSKELIELLFIQPYTKIAYLVEAGIAERRTASKYLKELESIGVLESFRSGKETIYVNRSLYDLLKK
jgi:cell filamentation protein, protein adenylyltransferase